MEELFFGAANINSPLRKVDIRIKIVAIMSFVFISSTLGSYSVLSMAAVFVLFLTAISKIQLSFLIKRLFWLFPFTGVLVLLFPFVIPGVPIWQINTGFATLTASDAGLQRAVVLSLRVIVAVLSINLLTANTAFRDLMAGCKDLRIPPIIIHLIEFTVRFMFILVDELQRMRIAQRSRGFQSGKSLFHRHTFRALGQLIGILFIRASKRSERVYNAMLARGFTGEMKTRSHFCLKIYDLWWGFTILAAGLSLKLVEFMTG